MRFPGVVPKANVNWFCKYENRPRTISKFRKINFTVTQRLVGGLESQRVDLQ